MDAYQQYCSSNCGLRENEASVSSFYQVNWDENFAVSFVMNTVFTITHGIGCDGFL